MQLPVDIAACIAAGHPFAIFRFPGEKAIRVAGSDCRFYINRWNTASDDNIDVSDVAPGTAQVRPWSISTGYDSYMASTGALIGKLRQRGGKCVHSRVLCASGVRLDVDGAVSELFERYPDAFCHCYYTPATGLWAGATPELLLDACGASVATMSLAGTRRAGTDEPWDIKNIEEQQLVTQFICDAMRDCGLEPEAGPTETLRYGCIEHICTPISAQMTGRGVEALLDALSPTPAVAGYPLAASVNEIAEYEDAPRRCYGGYVMVRDRDDRVRAFVNLRCAQLWTDAWCVYAGGGITPRSDASAEWMETAAKASVWLEILENNTLSPDA